MKVIDGAFFFLHPQKYVRTPGWMIEMKAHMTEYFNYFPTYRTKFTTFQRN